MDRRSGNHDDYNGGAAAGEKTKNKNKKAVIPNGSTASQIS